MSHYRNKPNQVEAIRWRGDNLDELFKLCGRIKQDGLYKGQIGVFGNDAGYRIAQIGDWIVKTPDGDIRPWKAALFEATYEAV